MHFSGTPARFVWWHTAVVLAFASQLLETRGEYSSPRKAAPDELRDQRMNLAQRMAPVQSGLAHPTLWSEHRADLTVGRADLGELRRDLAVRRTHLPELRRDLAVGRADLTELRRDLAKLWDRLTDIRVERIGLRPERCLAEQRIH